MATAAPADSNPAVAPDLGAVGEATPLTTNEQVPHGVKSWMIKQALHGIADGIRGGSWLVHELVRRLDKPAARVFKKYSHRIADSLDDVARIPDLTVRIVSEKLFYALVAIGIDAGSAKVIVGAVESVLWILL